MRTTLGGYEGVVQGGYERVMQGVMKVIFGWVFNTVLEAFLKNFPKQCLHLRGSYLSSI